MNYRNHHKNAFKPGIYPVRPLRRPGQQKRTSWQGVAAFAILLVGLWLLAVLFVPVG